MQVNPWRVGCFTRGVAVYSLSAIAAKFSQAERKDL